MKRYSPAQQQCMAAGITGSALFGLPTNGATTTMSVIVTTMPGVSDLQT